MFTTLLRLPTLTFLALSMLPAMAGPTNSLRYPVAFAITPDGRTAFTANSRSGTISVVDLEHLRLLSEYQLGGIPSDLAIHPSGEIIVVTDRMRGQLHVLKLSDRSLKSLTTVKTVAQPAQVLIGPKGDSLAVSSTWDRRVAVYSMGQHNDRFQVRQQHSVEMPFALREMLLFDDGGKLLIADAFGGNIAVLETETGSILSQRRLPGHNIRGLALAQDKKEVLVSHQILNPMARTTFNDIHWGILMANVVRSIPIKTLNRPKADLLTGSRLYRLGTSGPAAGDPAGIAVGRTGQVIIALSGVDAVEAGTELSELKRITTGKHPTDVRIHGNRAYVLNTFGDSLSVIDLTNMTTSEEISLGKQAGLTAEDRGEQLFFDARLSHNGWMSCHSCHTDGHSNGQLNDNLSDGSYGAPKRVLSLLGVGQTAPWAWNGSVDLLENQIGSSVANTMHGEKMDKTQLKDLAAYLKTLPQPPVTQPVRSADSITRGKGIFAEHDCGRCHSPPLYTSGDVYQVGLKDEVGRDEFNPPSLRGVAHRQNFFHDNRAKTLFHVLGRYRHQLKHRLSPSELLDLVAFLKTL
jgi:DNA-binding beta-propeller fold protein YncE